MSNSNSRSGPYKDYEHRISDTCNDFVEEQARTCNQCREPTIVANYLRTNQIETYDLDNNYPKQRKKHRHPANNKTKANVISAIAVEKRYLFERRAGDYDPISGSIIN